MRVGLSQEPEALAVQGRGIGHYGLSQANYKRGIICRKGSSFE